MPTHLETAKHVCQCCSMHSLLWLPPGMMGFMTATPPPALGCSRAIPPGLYALEYSPGLHCAFNVTTAAQHMVVLPAHMGGPALNAR
jgi:hypothetical protein